MDRSSQSGDQSEPDLSKALDRLWTRFLPEIEERVNALELAASTSLKNRLSASDREAAHAAAHKLAGVLGTFDLKRGSDLAHELEVAFSDAQGPVRESADVVAQAVVELRALIEGRKRGF